MASFHFIVPVVPREVYPARWEHAQSPDGRNVEDCLRNCLASLLNQSYEDFHIHVICHELPSGIQPLLDNGRVTVHKAPFPPPSRMDLKTYCRLSGKAMPSLPGMRRRRMGDKYSKIKLGLGHVLDDHDAVFSMFVDHDDLIHQDLVPYVLKERLEGGCLVNKGYSWRLGETRFRKLDSFYRLCGSCNVVRFSKEERRIWRDTRDVNMFAGHSGEQRKLHWLFAGHDSVHKRLRAASRAVQAVPFRAAVYATNVGTNDSGTRQVGQGHVVWTPKIKRAFGLDGV